jgi:hypothetical protein
MPNWCFNRLTVDTTSEGGKLLAKAFKPKHKREDGSLDASPFQDLLPCPKELLETQATFSKEPTNQQIRNKEKYGHTDWYSWNVANWGTKWDARVEDFDDSDPNQIYVYFETAWSPPVEFMKWFVSQHPDAYFRNEYDEEGMQFEGVTENSKKDGFIDECFDKEEEND